MPATVFSYTILAMLSTPLEERAMLTRCDHSGSSISASLVQKGSTSLHNPGNTQHSPEIPAVRGNRYRNAAAQCSIGGNLLRSLATL